MYVPGVGGSAWLNSGVARFLRRVRVRAAGFTPPLADGRGARLFVFLCVREDRAGVSRHRLLAPHVCDVSVLQPLFRALRCLYTWMSLRLFIVL